MHYIDRNKIITQGYMLLNQGLYDHAYKLFTDYLSNNPEDVEALIGLASTYQHKKKTDEAIKTAMRALEVDPEYFYAYDVLAEIYFINKNDYAKAEEFALKSIEIEPYSSSTYSLLSQIYFFQNNYNASYSYATEALRLDPENYVAHMALGLYYYHSGNFNKAEEHYKAALSIAPDSSVVYGNYGLLNLAFAQNKLGYKLLREAIRLNPEDKFLQESFREAYIRNNPYYAPLYWLSDGLIDDVYLIYASLVILIMCSFIAKFIHITGIFKYIMAVILILCFGTLFIMIIYRFISRFVINKYYSWAIKAGKLGKII